MREALEGQPGGWPSFHGNNRGAGGRSVVADNLRSRPRAGEGAQNRLAFSEASTHDELDNLLAVGTQDPLRKLVGNGRLTRHKLAGQFLYCAADRVHQAHQLRARRLLMATPGLVRPLPEADLMPEELRAAIVLFASLLDERQRRLFAGLEALKCGWGGDRRIAQLLGIDPSTVAAGRRQLVERDVEIDRVRRVGGGRPPAEKKRRKSSPTSKT